MVAVFGFERFDLAGPFEAVRPVFARFLPSPACGNIAGGHDAFDVRQALQSNRARNDRIARTARSIAQRLPEAIAGSTDRQQSMPRGVIIVVDDVKHAICLARKLPNWRIIAKQVLELSLTKQERNVLAARKGPVGTNAIVTLSALHSLKLDGFDWVIRAATGPGLLPLNSVTKHRASDPLFVIDFADRQHPQLRRWLDARKKAYFAAGWTPLGMDPTRARVEQFLRDHEAQDVD